MKLQKIYDPAIDALRLVAILAVVLIHTTAYTLQLNHYDLVHHEVSLFLNQAARFAVPLFFLISGFVLELNSSPSGVRKYFQKRFGKIVIPYIFWSVIYYFFIYTKHADSFLKALLTGSASYQLYFIPSLFLFYLIFPLLHCLMQYINARDSSTTLRMTLLIGLFVIQMAILNYDYSHFSFPLPYPLAVVVFNFFVFILGMYFAQKREQIKKIVEKFWPFFIIGAVVASYIIFKEGFNYYYKVWNFEAIYRQWRPSILLYTIFIFGSLYFIFSRINLRVITNLSKLSFFIFFVHVIILEVIAKYVYTNDIAFFACVASGSILIAYLASKVKYLNKLTG